MLSIYESKAAELLVFGSVNGRWPALMLRENQATCAPVISRLHALLHCSPTAKLFSAETLALSALFVAACESSEFNVSVLATYDTLFWKELCCKQKLQGSVVLPSMGEKNRSRRAIQVRIKIIHSGAQLWVHLDWNVEQVFSCCQNSKIQYKILEQFLSSRKV